MTPQIALARSGCNRYTLDCANLHADYVHRSRLHKRDDLYSGYGDGCDGSNNGPLADAASREFSTSQISIKKWNITPFYFNFRFLCIL